MILLPFFLIIYLYENCGAAGGHSSPSSPVSDDTEDKNIVATVTYSERELGRLKEAIENLLNKKANGKKNEKMPDVKIESVTSVGECSVVLSNFQKTKFRASKLSEYAEKLGDLENSHLDMEISDEEDERFEYNGETRQSTPDPYRASTSASAGPEIIDERTGGNTDHNGQQRMKGKKSHKTVKRPLVISAKATLICGGVIAAQFQVLFNEDCPNYLFGATTYRTKVRHILRGRIVAGKKAVVSGLVTVKKGTQTMLRSGVDSIHDFGIDVTCTINRVQASFAAKSAKVTQSLNEHFTKSGNDTNNKIQKLKDKKRKQKKEKNTDTESMLT